MVPRGPRKLLTAGGVVQSDNLDDGEVERVTRLKAVRTIGSKYGSTHVHYDLLVFLPKEVRAGLAVFDSAPVRPFSRKARVVQCEERQVCPIKMVTIRHQRWALSPELSLGTEPFTIGL